MRRFPVHGHILRTAHGLRYCTFDIVRGSRETGRPGSLDQRKARKRARMRARNLQHKLEIQPPGS